MSSLAQGSAKGKGVRAGFRVLNFNFRVQPTGENSNVIDLQKKDATLQRLLEEVRQSPKIDFFCLPVGLPMLMQIQREISKMNFY